METNDTQVDVNSLSDSDLDAHLSNLDDSALDQLINESGGYTEDSTKVSTEQSSVEPDKEGQTSKPPLTIEDLNKEVEVLKETLSKKEKQVLEKDNLINRHRNELGALRELKAKILERTKVIDAQDATQRLISDPRGFTEDIKEKINLENQLKDIEHKEQAATITNHYQQNFDYLKENAPEMFNIEGEKVGPSDVFNEMVNIVVENGKDDPRMVEAFKQNPFAFPISNVLSLYVAAKNRTEVAKLKQEVESLRSKPERLLDKIEAASKAQPLANKSGGKTDGTVPDDLSYEQLDALSDKELSELLKSLNVKY